LSLWLFFVAERQRQPPPPVFKHALDNPWHQRKSLAADVLRMRRAVAALASNANFLPRHFSASPASTHHSPPPPASPSSTFIEDPAVAFKDKTDIEIARAWLVFRLCAIRPVVENASQLLKLSR
jgi:hypothetical protein